MGFMEDGDWPPNAGMLGLSTLPDEVKAALPQERSMVGQEWVEFQAGDEERVVATITSLGYDLRRDDGAIKDFDKLSFGQ